MNPTQTKPKQILVKPEAVLLQTFKVNERGGLVINREHVPGGMVRLTIEWPEQQGEQRSSKP
jgi:hypothetical protein